MALGCALVVLIALLCLMEPADAAKKKKSKAKKAKTAAATEPARCGVCIAAVDEIFKELAVTENSTSTLDLRWGLTAQVTDGRAKRIGKVIKYNRSQLRAIEVMEKICGEMKQYERYAAVAGEVQLKSRAEIKRLNPGKTSSNPDEEKEEKKRDTRCSRAEFCPPGGGSTGLFSSRALLKLLSGRALFSGRAPFRARLLVGRLVGEALC